MKIDITFNKVGELWEAEFEATADFALHIERSDVGTIQLFQNTSSSNGYAIVEDFRFDNRNKLVIDYDTPVLIPKRIKIISKVLPTYAAITTDGDVVEIKSQSKTVEISSNGTTSVEPDAGFSYLSKVDVKVDVPQSGGGEGGTEENKVVYLNIAPCVAAMGSQFGNDIKILPGFLAMKVSDGDVINILPPSAIASEHYASVTEAALLPNFKGYIQPDHLNDVNSDATINQFKLMGATEITEEEFYNLES